MKKLVIEFDEHSEDLMSALKGAIELALYNEGCDVTEVTLEQDSNDTHLQVTVPLISDSTE